MADQKPTQFFKRININNPSKKLGWGVRKITVGEGANEASASSAVILEDVFNGARAGRDGSHWFTENKNKEIGEVEEIGVDHCRVSIIDKDSGTDT